MTLSDLLCRIFGHDLIHKTLIYGWGAVHINEVCFCMRCHRSLMDVVWVFPPALPARIER